ncbi:MFS transporter [Streptomyces sp. WMMC500]|uniref:MFS transporter n=1 Tax=Streptomyces sp. WMMC500 TaxID=3015154 RepID=UPI00248BDEA8|nr:MFS transporter [Streptomyces sp. WMMC500]WBB58166.1 MFS transporter [Streptomyces sp. WMMC500]
MGRLPAGQRLPRSVWVLVAARTVNRLGAFSLPFLAVLITRRYDAPPATAGLVVALFGLATIPSRLAGGRLADRYGRRRTMLVGLVGCAVAQAGVAAAPNLAVVVGFAVLLGLVFELYEPPSQAMIADAVGDAARVRAYSLLNAALAVAGLAAGVLAAGLGRWDLRWLFVADAVTCLLCALVVRIALPADGPGADRRGDGRTAVAPWRDRTLLAMLGTGTLFALVYLQITVMLPLALDRRGLQPADAGLLLAVSALVIVAGQPLLRLNPLSARSAPGAFATGGVLLAAGLAGYAVADGFGAHVAATVVWSLGDLLLVGRALAVVAGLAPPGGTGRYLAVYGTGWGIAAVVAPLLGTQLLDRAGVAGMWSVMAGLCAVLAVVQPAVVRAAAGRRRTCTCVS